MSESSPRPKNIQHEWTEQRVVNAFLSKALPPDAYYTAIDIGRSKNAAAGALRKLRGVKSGIPDWLILYCGTSLWIEQKAGSALSPNQIVTRDALIRNGHKWALARSVEDIEHACRDAGIPLRATFGEIRERIAEQKERNPGIKKRSPRKAAPRFSMTVARARKTGVWG